MARSSALTGSQGHFRSISLPSRLHPHCGKIEAELNKLKTWEISTGSASPLNAETIRTGLVGLPELYNRVEELIRSPVTRQVILQHQHGVLVEEALEGSIGLLDSCSMARDFLSLMKESVQDLQSVLRRKGADSSTASNLSSYLCCRKKVKKNITRGLRSLKQIEMKTGPSPLLDRDQDHYLSMMIRVLREVIGITISVIRCVLVFLQVPVSKSKAKGWSLISKLMITRQVAASESGHGKIFNEVGSVDEAIQSLHGCLRSNNGAKIGVEMARRRLQALNDRTEGLEAGLDCLFRRLIQHRVSLLNILAH
ncbi:uncharacterized protein LOC127804329 [Diospyros lotus]|uniref:uncharacterized protein LOC127804329 n=1 Tax=Diospyros lotus TaxID=55363 RepID=UPI00224E1A88|nr:uncharacterized protein LOC127804329 [Diospyros lotus]